MWSPNCNAGIWCWLMSLPPIARHQIRLRHCNFYRHFLWTCSFSVSVIGLKWNTWCRIPATEKFGKYQLTRWNSFRKSFPVASTSDKTQKKRSQVIKLIWLLCLWGRNDLTDSKPFEGEMKFRAALFPMPTPGVFESEAGRFLFVKGWWALCRRL